MMSKYKKLVERLRESGNMAMACSVDIRDAQDAIEALEAEIEEARALVPLESLQLFQDHEELKEQLTQITKERDRIKKKYEKLLSKSSKWGIT